VRHPLFSCAKLRANDKQNFVTLAVQIFVVFYLALAAMAAWLLWNNAAAPDSIKNLGIGFASLLPLLVAILPYLNQEKLENKFSFVLIYDQIEKEMLHSGGIYSDSYLEMFTNLSSEHTKFENSEDFVHGGFDVIEKGIIQSLLTPFPASWKSGSHRGVVHWVEPETSRESHLIALDELREIFRHNPLIATPGILYGDYWSLPPKSKVSLNQRRFSRTVTVTNPYGTLTIEIYSLGGQASGGVWGILERDPKKHLRYLIFTYGVSVTFVVARFKNYEKMASYKVWHENICRVLSEFDWKRVEEKIEKRSTREAIPKLSNSDEKRSGRIRRWAGAILGRFLTPPL